MHSLPRKRRKKRSFGKIFVLMVVAIIALGSGVAVSAYHAGFGGDLNRVLEQFSPELPVNILPKKDNVPDWNNEERVNVLLLGVDRRESDAGAPTRTDTILVATFNPSDRTAGLLSIPRDLWVDIPLKDGSIIQDRINTAFFYGDFYHYPGGSAALAAETIRYNLGIKIHYYAVLEFDGFEKIIDTLGGITINLKQPLIDPQYPTADNRTMRIYIPAGVQHLDGEKALWYARSRYQEADFGRMRHQQEVLMAIKERVLQLGILPRMPQLIGQLGGAIKTDLSIPEIMTLADMFRDVQPENITSRVIDQDYIIPQVIGGGDVLVPDKSKIKGLISEMFADSKLKNEDAAVLVLNGTTKAGIAAKVGSYLQGQGIRQVNSGNADSLNYKQTIIYDCSGKSYTASLIANLLGVPQSRVKQKTPEPSDGDVTIILGDDAKIPQ